MIETTLLSLGVLVLFLTLGVPLLFCFGAALATLYVFGDGVMTGNILWGVQQLKNPMLLALPLFVLTGMILGRSGIAASLLAFVDVFIGHVRGGLGVVVTLSCAIIGAISGSGLTGVAAIGPLFIPEMERRGYPRAYAAALVANSSLLGLLIPPSVPMIVYGWVTGTSVLACFLATLLPGLLVMVLFSLVDLWTTRKFRLVLQPQPTAVDVLAQAGQRGRHAAPALALPVIILGGIYGGFMTPTEAAAVAVVYAAVVGAFVYRGLTADAFWDTGKEAATATGTLMLMILFSMILSQVFVVEGLPQRLTETMLAVTVDKGLLLLMVNIVLFLVGMVVNDVTVIVLLAPFLLPLMNAIGVDPVQFAAIMGVNTAMGGITPPYASILYLGARVGGVEVREMIGPALRLLLFGYLPVVFLTSFWPDLSLFLPTVFGY